MNTLQEFKFKNIYELTDLIDGHVKADVEFWNYNEEYFLNTATKFSKDTLLHLYIVTTALNFYRRDFRKNGYDEDEESMEKWYSLFDSYQIEIKKFNFNGKRELVYWFERNITLFDELFNKMADEVFYILFSNRQFRLDFNNLTTKTIMDTIFPPNCLTNSIFSLAFSNPLIAGS